MKEIDSDLSNIIFVNFPLTCTKEMWCSVSRASHPENAGPQTAGTTMPSSIAGP